MFEKVKKMSSVITNRKTGSQMHEEKLNSKQFKIRIAWQKVFVYMSFHAVGLYGIYLCFTSTNWKTILFGWLMCRKHSAVIEAGEKLPVDDLLADPVVRFNKKYYIPMWIIFCLIVPTVIPMYFWGEKWMDALFVSGVLRFVFQLHSTFTINSVAHTYGYRPFDRRMEARESFFTETMQPGEGSHNYHHVFPRDYKTKDSVLSFNSSRFFLEFMEYIGQAYDLKLSSDKLIEARKMKTGDGSK